jgi:hypothetical protein
VGGEGNVLPQIGNRMGAMCYPDMGKWGGVARGRVNCKGEGRYDDEY